MVIGQEHRIERPAKAKKTKKPVKPPPPLENGKEGVRESIKGYLTTRGWFVSTIKERYFPKGAKKGQFSDPGIPDLICIKNGRVVMLEVKRPLSPTTRYSQPSDSQKKWHAEWQAQGGEVYVVRSLEDALEVCDKDSPDEVMF